jgi:hypothetical protein
VISLASPTHGLDSFTPLFENGCAAVHRISNARWKTRKPSPVVHVTYRSWPQVDAEVPGQQEAATSRRRNIIAFIIPVADRVAISEGNGRFIMELDGAN